MLTKSINVLKKEVRYRIRKLIKPRMITLYGVKIDLTLDVITPEIKEFMYKEGYEIQEINILSKVLEKNDKVMEIGAGIGFLSTFIAKHIGSDKVIAYEANPKLIPAIQYIYQINGVSPKVKNCILADSDGLYDFYLEEQFWSSSIVKRTPKAKKIQVKKRNVNEEIDQFKPNFLVIDIEGGECDLIFSIKNWSCINKILIEVHPHIIGDDQVTKVIEFIIFQDFLISINTSQNNILYFYRK